MDGLKLVLPGEKYAEQIMAYRDEFLAAQSSMDGCCGTLRGAADAKEFLKNCEVYRNPDTVPEGKVPDTELLLIREADDRLVGMTSVRHCLNDYLGKYGGHIGYSVRPSERRKGYAKQMLKLALSFCRKELGLEKVLVTCNEDNIGSERTILANGGVYENTLYEPNLKVYRKRFWIETASLLP